jgi:hypothetical protein
VTDNPAITPAAREAVEGGLTQALAKAGDAQLEALRLALGAVALAALLSPWLTRGLPARSLAEGEVGAAEAAAVALRPSLEQFIRSG